MALMTLRAVQLSYGSTPLLDQVSLAIDRGERLCLVGRNGAGKSTLMKVIAGDVKPDDGLIEVQQGVTIARLEQEVPRDTDGSVYDTVAAGLGEAGTLLARFHHLATAMGAGEDVLDEFQTVQMALEACDGWGLDQRVAATLSRLNLDGDQPFAGLSGGMKRRVLLARALVQQPDILLLDEPTNHLDIASIQWLEEFLRGFGGTLVFITHDRAFIRALATRIIELDRGHLTSWPGDYQKYLDGKQAALEAEERAQAEFDKKLAREEAWIRQGIKARRTRNEGRVRALKALRNEYAERRQRQGNVSLTVQDGVRSGKLVLEARDLYFAHGDRVIVPGLDLTLLRGDRLGIIGPNGCGKSTLLRLLLGQLEPQRGSVRHGTQLEVAYFDQMRHALDEERTVLENVTEGSDTLIINGQPRHAIGYLQDFLFEPARARQPVKALSGGERNRLLLAKLFTRPVNLLVLDEPTNDLDAETLDLLEEQMMQFQGTLLLVSHDREFIDNVVTSTLVFEHGQLNEYVGGYQDWLRQRPATPASPVIAPAEPASAGAPAKAPTAAPAPARAGRRLSYAERIELEKLPAQIEALEQQIAALGEAMSDPAFYQQPQDAIQAVQEQLEQLNGELERTFGRWEELDRQGE